MYGVVVVKGAELPTWLDGLRTMNYIQKIERTTFN
jgi:hypothetical protein